MGMDDGDWYREARREREKQRQIDETRARFSAFSDKNLKSASATTTGLVPMIVVWCAVMGLLYVLMTHYFKPKQAQVLANGDLVISRSQDGHFYTTGTVNHREAKFMIDTGATLVGVSEKFAQKAFLHDGIPTTFKTANGAQPGRIVEGVDVAIGPVMVSNVRVGVGLRGEDENDALLGQSFLSKFDITMTKNQLVLRSR